MNDELRVVLFMGAAFVGAFAVFPRRFNRKIVHIIAGYTFANFYQKAAGCPVRISLLPLTATILYSVSLLFQRLSFIARFVAKDGRLKPAGIIVYGLLMTALPFCGCRTAFARALICVSAGDGFAGLAQFVGGKRVRLAWNREKSLLGFALCYAGSFLGLYLYDGRIDFLTPLVASVAESTDFGEDNIVVFAAAYFSYFAFSTTLAVLGIANLALFAWRNRMLTPGASIVGALECSLIWGASALQTLALLVFAVGGLFSSHFNRRFVERKNAPTVAKHQEKEFSKGRGLSSVLSNSLPQAVCAALTVLLPEHRRALTICSIAASAECLADTFGSDFGSVLGAQPRHPVLLFRKVRRGANGGVSLVGTAAGACGALCVSQLAYLVGYDWAAVAKVFCAALLGFYADSVLGIFAQYSGAIGDYIVNRPDDAAESVGGRDLFSNSAVNCICCSLSCVACAFLLVM